MRCPVCRKAKTQVRDSRTLLEDGTTRRKRQCLSCGAGFFTLERIECSSDSQALWVVKNNGNEERFAEQKLTQSLTFALTCSPAQVRSRGLRGSREKTAKNLSEKICNELQGAASGGKGRRCISSRRISSCAAKVLREQDFAAYVRYVSAGRNFCSLQDFTDFFAVELASNNQNGSHR